MTTAVRAAAPGEARSTALALRLTGYRLGQVATPAAAGLVAGLVAGVTTMAAPFVLFGGLPVSSEIALRSPGGTRRGAEWVTRECRDGPGLRRMGDI